MFRNRNQLSQKQALQSLNLKKSYKVWLKNALPLSE